MATDPPPDYYAILGISESASTSQVRDAYKRAALKTHPDRAPADSPERASRTRKFQLVNDAYYTLSDHARRSEYDAQRRMFGGGTGGGAEEEEEAGEEGRHVPGASWAWDFFSGREPGRTRQQAESEQFGDVFEEMLREEGMAEPGTNQPTNRFWSVVGGLSGGALGFIVANVPGMLAGAVAGNRLGAIRDTRGKSVYQVFQELPQDDRARLLSQLAARVLSHAVGI